MKHTISSTLRHLGILCLLLASSVLGLFVFTTQQSAAAPAVPGQVFPLQQTPGATESAIAVTANGQSIFVEQYKDVHYARFAFSGAVDVVVTPAAAVEAYTISPQIYNIQSTSEAGNISFALNEPRHLILQLGTEKLFLLTDAPRTDQPAADGENVFNVATYVSDTTGSAVQTANIQRAIDDAAHVQGTVYFPEGTYLSGGLIMRSNTTLYLAPGALLLGVLDANSFGEGHFLLFEDVSNVHVYGQGTLDLRGIQLRARSGDDGRVKIIRTIRASNIQVEDILLRDAGSWTVHIIGSQDVTMTNVKIINDSTNTNGDGFDPDSSQRVTIDRAFVYTTDDCFAIKTSGTFKVLQPTSDILIKNSVCYTKKSALKVGTETRADLTNITFENNAVVQADRVMSLYMSDGHTMQNIVYRNNSSETVGGDAKQRLMDFKIDDRAGVGDIRDVLISNHTAYQFGRDDSEIIGMGGHIVNVTMQNLVIEGQVRTTVEDARIVQEEAEVSFIEGEGPVPGQPTPATTPPADNGTEVPATPGNETVTPTVPDEDTSAGEDEEDQEDEEGEEEDEKDSSCDKD